jgi:hypothetical protein
MYILSLLESEKLNLLVIKSRGSAGVGAVDDVDK